GSVLGSHRRRGRQLWDRHQVLLSFARRHRRLPQAPPPGRPRTGVGVPGGWRWQDLDEARFVRLAGNFGRWAEQHSVRGDPASALYALLLLFPAGTGSIEVKGLAIGPQAAALAAEHLGAIEDGVGAATRRTTERT